MLLSKLKGSVRHANILIHLGDARPSDHQDDCTGTSGNLSHSTQVTLNVQLLWWNVFSGRAALRGGVPNS